MVKSRYILNHTFIVEDHIHDQWVRMMTKMFFPRLKKAGCKPRLSRIHAGDDANHSSYSLMLEFETQEQHQQTGGVIMGECYTQMQEQFKDNVLWFTSLLETIKK